MYITGIAYLLWFVSGFGALGFHRFYLGKVPTGLLWFFTGGLGMVGSIYDLFTLPGQVREANLKQALIQQLNSGTPRNRQVNWRNVDDGKSHIVNHPKDSVERIILKLAKKNKGVLTVSEVALEANISVDEAKKNLELLTKKGFTEIRVRKNGVIVYVIPEYADTDTGYEDF